MATPTPLVPPDKADRVILVLSIDPWRRSSSPGRSDSNSGTASQLSTILLPQI